MSDAEYDVVVAAQDLKDALGRYHKATALATGKPVHASYPIDHFLIVSTYKSTAGTIYHMANDGNMEHHETLGLAQILADRVRDGL